MSYRSRRNYSDPFPTKDDSIENINGLLASYDNIKGQELSHSLTNSSSNSSNGIRSTAIPAIHRQQERIKNIAKVLPHVLIHYLELIYVPILYPILYSIYLYV